MKKSASKLPHSLPVEMRNLINANKHIQNAWNEITPLARNEWICWAQSVKKEETKKQKLIRFAEDILNGKKRPCCWPGCKHR